MICSSLRRILPELVSGELSDSISQEALSHIRECPACTREYESYRKALNALSEPRRLMDVPDSLNYLHLPDRQRSHQHKRLSLALAAVLIAVLALGFIRHFQPDQKPVAYVKKTHPIEKRIVMKNTPQEQEQQKDIAINHNRLVSREPVKHTPARHRVNGQSQSQRIVAINPEKPKPAQSQIKTPEPDKIVQTQDNRSIPKEPEEPTSPVIVVAAWAEPQVPYNVEIEVKNPDSGMVSLCSVSRDEDGKEQEQSISVKADVNTLDNRRTEL